MNLQGVSDLAKEATARVSTDLQQSCQDGVIGGDGECVTGSTLERWRYG